jgi:hypothetical protein
MADEKKIRPVYQELQGYLAQAPSEGIFPDCDLSKIY